MTRIAGHPVHGDALVIPEHSACFLITADTEKFWAKFALDPVLRKFRGGDRLKEPSCRF